MSSHGTQIRWLIAVVVAAAVVSAVFACGESADEPTAAPTPTPTSVPTSTPTPTSTSVPDIPVDRDEIPVGDLTVPVCVPSDPNGSSSVGTAPGANPTPTPSAASRDVETITAEVSAYLAVVTPVVSHLGVWEAWLNESWALESSHEQRAAMLQLAGIKVAQACDALYFVSLVPPEASDLHAAAVDAAMDRLTWIKQAADSLKEDSTAQPASIEDSAFSISSLLEQIADEISGLEETHNVVKSAGHTVSDPAIGIQVDLPEGWFAFPESLNFAITAPPALNGDDMASLGPESWQLGTSLRIRRLRGAGEMTPAAASSLFNGLVTQQGSIDASTDTEIDGFPALRHELAVNNDWDASVTVVVVGQFVYFIETGCLVSSVDGCSGVQALAESIHFLES